MTRSQRTAAYLARLRAAAVAGHTGDSEQARASLSDPTPRVREAALGALVRLGALFPGELAVALADADPGVRRRACEEAARVDYEIDLRPLLADAHPWVVEAAAWALGERGDAKAVDELGRVATAHPEPLCREAAVAALGAIGDERGLPSILAGTRDKPAVRRRAVVALAPFEGADVDEALARASHDRDWQVRQAAEDLLSG